jgi:hypothetical protein
MPIEDIDYLKENSTEENQIVYIDSSQRNYEFYPTPSHYVWKFSHPFRNVFNIEVLEAKMPTCVFNIDADTNLMYYMTYSPKVAQAGNSNVSSDMIQSIIDQIHYIPGVENLINSTLETLPVNKQQLNSSFFTGTAIMYRIMVKTYDSFVETRADVFDSVASMLQYVDLPAPKVSNGTPYLPSTTAIPLLVAHNTGINNGPNTTDIFFNKKWKIQNVPMFSDLAQLAGMYATSQYYEIVYNDAVYYTSNYMFYLFMVCFNTLYQYNNFYEYLFSFQGQDTGNHFFTRTFVLTETSANHYTWEYITVRASFLSRASPNLDMSLDQEKLYLLCTKFAPGNYNISTLIDFSNQDYFVNDPTGVPLAPDIPQVQFDASQNPAYISTFPYLTLQNNSTSTAFVVNNQTSTISLVVGMNDPSLTTMPSKYKKVYFQNNVKLYGSIYTQKTGKHKIDAPGVAYFNHTDYVILRCEEIEDNMYGSYCYGDFTPGIGVFTFYNTVSNFEYYTKQVFDYRTYNKKPFHPIGKLDRLTLKFYKPDGKTLYNFKGLNHSIFLNIKYYAPFQTKRMERSVLNPNYNPNFREYYYQSIDARALDQKSEDDENICVEDIKRLRLIENKHNCSSSDGYSDIVETTLLP